MAERRFTYKEEKGWMKGTQIIVDQETGVQYLFANWGGVGGVTLLVDKDGKPLLDQNYEK